MAARATATARGGGVDPHSYTPSGCPLVSAAALSFFFDFSTRTLRSSALLTLSSPVPAGDPLILDTRDLAVVSVSDPSTGAPLPFHLSPAEPILGSKLTISPELHPAQQILILFSTSPSSSALQWLTPLQAATPSNSPFVYTQCHPIHARSVFPCHDTPAARIRYRCLLNLPSPLSAVMAASHVARRSPSGGENRGACDDALWCSDGRAVEEFAMDEPIPPYLFAFAAGDIVSREIGPRTTVYVAGAAGLLDAAAKEFAVVEDLIRAGEMLFGAYDWGRFDLLLLPPSFPYGGMENPKTVFLTPTAVTAAGAQLVAHELAHCWTGNLITNKSNEDFWLNEGFAVYAERRIVEAVQGVQRAALSMGRGWNRLKRTIVRFQDSMDFTRLKPNLSGVDPDEVHSEIPYEKGFQFLWRIEHEIGRPKFDEFLKKYISTFKFQSIDTEEFLEFLKANVDGIEARIDLEEWVKGTGLPPDAMEPVSDMYNKICSLAAESNKHGKIPGREEVADWTGQEWELYLDNLPRDVEASQIVVALDELHRLSESRDLSVKVSFLQLAITGRCRQYYGEAETVLKQVGRMRYLRPLYSLLAKGSEEEKVLAKSIFAEARDFYHPIACSMVDSILSKHC